MERLATHPVGVQGVKVGHRLDGQAGKGLRGGYANAEHISNNIDIQTIASLDNVFSIGNIGI